MIEPYIGMSVKVVKGFSVGSRGVITSICEAGDNFDVKVLRAGCSTPMGYWLSELVVDEPPPPSSEIRLLIASSAGDKLSITMTVDASIQTFTIGRRTAASAIAAISKALADDFSR